MEEAGLDAIRVGALAARLQGAAFEATRIEWLIRDTPRNREKLARVAAALACPRVPLLGLRTMSLVGAPHPIDVTFERLPGCTSFAALRARAARVAVGGGAARVASLADLIDACAASGLHEQLSLLRRLAGMI